jgi:hypothetical protein
MAVVADATGQHIFAFDKLRGGRRFAASSGQRGLGIDGVTATAKSRSTGEQTGGEQGR